MRKSISRPRLLIADYTMRLLQCTHHLPLRVHHAHRLIQGFECELSFLF